VPEPESHSQDHETRDPDSDEELEVDSRWTRRRRHAAETGDTGVQVVVPTGYPGRVLPRLTGRRPAHSRGDGGTGTGGRWLIIVASAVLLVVASIAVADLARGSRHARETRLGNPVNPTNLWPVYSAPPDYGTLPPDAGVPGDGSAPPTASAAPATSSPAPPVAAPGVPPAPKSDTAVAGEGCTQTADHGYFRSGFASDWRTRSGGGLTTDGCHGAVVAVPMSGDARRDDNDNVIVWWFRTAPVAAGSCALSVYVPDTGNDSDSAGKPAHYLVFRTDNASGTTAGEFDVDQTRNRGRWVDAGRFPTGGRLSVRMVTRGIDFGPGREGAHLGVSALRASCTAS
jgi:hypothetical protein